MVRYFLSKYPKTKFLKNIKSIKFKDNEEDFLGVHIPYSTMVRYFLSKYPKTKFFKNIKLIKFKDK